MFPRIKLVPFHVSVMCATCATQIFTFHLVNPMLFRQECLSRNSSICSFYPTGLTASLLRQQNLSALRLFLKSDFRRDLNVVIFLSGDSPASEFYVWCQHLWRWNWKCVPKRRHIEFRRRRITQKKEQNESDNFFFHLLLTCISVYLSQYITKLMHKIVLQ